jgi:hypothetical protein
VAGGNSRRFVGIELNPEYVKIAEKRLGDVSCSSGAGSWDTVGVRVEDETNREVDERTLGVSNLQRLSRGWR